MHRLLLEILKSSVKKTARYLGVDIQYLSKVPRYNALGLRSMNIRTVLDVGANSGQFVRYMRATLPNAKVICFEPLAEPFGELRTWANSQNGAVSVHNLALGDRNCDIEMYQHTEFSPSSSLLHSTATSHLLFPLTRGEKPVAVQMMTLDTFMEQSRTAIEPNLLIKLDVQGYEDRVIRGGLRTFAMAKACISEITFDNLYDGQCTFKDVCSLLDELGYRFSGTFEQFSAPDGHAIFADLLFLR
jgi:FkbM family methyltransferase